MYHFVSLIPLAIIIILSLTIIYKKFGKGVSVILITLAGLSTNALTYNIEVRMYSWGALFILLSFLELYNILDKEKNIDYILFTLYALAAAYTHYYCLISVFFLYIILIIVSIFFKRLNVRKVLLVCAFTVIGYLPWCSTLLSSLLSRTDSYWIETIPSIKNSFKYLFSNLFGVKTLVMISIATLIVFCYETNIIKISKKDKKINIDISIKNFYLSNDIIWIIAGIISIVGTISFGIIISNLIRPFYILRYIYPVSIIAWILLGIIFNKLKCRKLIITLLICFLLFKLIPNYMTIYKQAEEKNKSLENTLEATQMIDENDRILTTVSAISWTVGKYYYPETEVKKISLADLENIEDGQYYLIVLYNEKENTLTYLNNLNISYNTIVESEYLGSNYKVNIYEIYIDEYYTIISGENA